jgi:preprotein translocase subunit YajC
MMWTDAFAQAQAASTPANPMVSTLLMLLQFVPIFLIVYFLIIRPQRQRQKQLEKMVKALKKGDRVLTSGGIFGTVVGIDDSKAVLRIAEDIKVEFSKGSIVQVMVGDAK